MVGVSFRGEILLFGGNASFNMYIFSEEGDFISDLSEDPLIPGDVGQGSVISQKGRVYAGGFRKLEGVLKWRAYEFEGSKWSILSEQVID